MKEKIGDVSNTQKIKKPTKTISGVTPLAVMLPPRKCDHGTCLYCPSYGSPSDEKSKNEISAPQSYTPESPAVLRARECNYDPIKQINVRIKAFEHMRRPTEKIELIIMGGTFLSYPKSFQREFIKKCYDALNHQGKNNLNESKENTIKISKNLEEAKKINENAFHRCVALCIETRPDVCTDSQIRDILEYGATRVELGVQAIDNEIYKKVNRGHTVQDVIDATTRLKKAGFKIGYHLMPGIPGSNPKKDIKMFKEIFSSTKFKPDQIKIYPCQVLKGSGIENIYYGGEYIPYTKEQAAKLIIEMLKLTPRYCRIMRIMREIPLHYLVAGIKNIDMRHDIEKNINRNKSKIVEIRFREIGFAVRDKRKINRELELKITKYKASGGKEYFIEIINKNNILFGLLRLRLDKNNPAMIRELHVYGQALNITDHSNMNYKEASQHEGLGKQLIKEAERIAKRRGHKSLNIISGVGVRQYYKKLGYTIDKKGIYMEKFI